MPNLLRIPALLLLLAGCGGASAAKRPNLLFVVFDTTRADHLSCYGYERETTPTVDALAAEGLLCESTYSQSSLTPVSAGTFLTGTLPPRHGVRSLFVVGEETLSPDVTTLAERLQAFGYDTAGFVSAAPMGARYGLARGFDEYSDDVQQGARKREAEGLGNAYQRRADQTTDKALAWLDAREGGAPFALLVHFFDAHDATLVPPRAFLEERVSFPLAADLDERGHLTQVKEPARRIELYDAELEFMDAQLARLLRDLEARGKRERTVVVVLADHGEGLGQHDFWTHGLLWNEQLHVPLVLNGPGVPRGARLAARVRLVDLVPTLLEVLDVDPGAAPLDGSSFLRLLHGEEPPREVFAEVHHSQGDQFGRAPELYSLTYGRWKYVHSPSNGKHELYDLEADPGELRNLYAPEHPLAVTLAGRIQAWDLASGAAPALDDLQAEDVEMLKQLGYL